MVQATTMLPSSICSMGQIPRISPHSYGMLPKQMSKGHPPMITRGTIVFIGIDVTWHELVPLSYTSHSIMWSSRDRRQIILNDQIILNY